MICEDNILKLDKAISKEKEIILGEYLLKFQLRDNLDISVNEKIVSIYARNINIIEPVIYKKIITYDDSKTLGKLFYFCDSIDEVYEHFSNLIDNDGIEIKELVNGNFISITMESKFLSKKLSATIKLLINDFNKEEILEMMNYYQINYDKIMNENFEIKKLLEEKNQIISELRNTKKSISCINQKLNNLEEENNKKKKQLKEKNQRIKELELINKNFIKNIIDNGIDIHKEDENGEILLFKICENGNETFIKYLVEYENEYGETLLFKVCENGNETLVKYLIEHGADINKVNSFGLTPIFNACRIGNENIVKYLIEHGAAINRESNNGYTPLYCADLSGNKDLIRYLKKKGLKKKNTLKKLNKKKNQ
eukprot:jgi/Orpsp1_1/1179701/evm.model.c7180000070405.1